MRIKKALTWWILNEREGTPSKSVAVARLPGSCAAA